MNFYTTTLTVESPSLKDARKHARKLLAFVRDVNNELPDDGLTTIRVFREECREDDDDYL